MAPRTYRAKLADPPLEQAVQTVLYRHFEVALDQDPGFAMKS